jgi:hypothetical protein
MLVAGERIDKPDSNRVIGGHILQFPLSLLALFLLLARFLLGYEVVLTGGKYVITRH